MNHKEIENYFTTDNPRKVSTLTDDAPQWLRDVVYELHTGLPSDELYSMVHKVAESLAEYDELNEDTAYEIADSLVEFRTLAVWQWAISGEGSEMVNEYLSDIGSVTIDDMADLTQVFMSANTMAYERIASALIYAAMDEE
jgi:hypothetical protein